MAEGPVLLISDLHLEEARPDLARAFFHFLEQVAPSASALYILGDFFNLWIGDDAASDFHLSIAAALAGLSRSGTALFLMHGNRDFLLGESFARECGATLVGEPRTLVVAGKHYLLLHGDSLCTQDSDYQRFRSLVRDPAWQQSFLSRPLSERQAFAAQARAQSKAMSSNKPADIMDVCEADVLQLLSSQGNPVLVHGHTHRPAVHDFSLGSAAARRIVLGDWDRRGWYLRLHQGEEMLIDFPIRPSD